MEKSTDNFICMLGWYSTSHARVESTGILLNFQNSAFYFEIAS